MSDLSLMKKAPPLPLTMLSLIVTIEFPSNITLEFYLILNVPLSLLT